MHVRLIGISKLSLCVCVDACLSLRPCDGLAPAQVVPASCTQTAGGGQQCPAAITEKEDKEDGQRPWCQSVFNLHCWKLVDVFKTTTTKIYKILCAIILISLSLSITVSRVQSTQ